MANEFLHELTDTWSSGVTSYNAIKMNVADAASAADSKLINMQVGSVEKFTVSKQGHLVAVGNGVIGGTLGVVGEISAASLILLTDLAVAHGGTGASDPAGARASLEAQRAVDFVQGLEVGAGNTGDRFTAVDLHSHGAGEVDFSARISRAPGANGSLNIVQTGTGAVDFAGSGGLTRNNNPIWHGGNDGPGSALDADLLDGLHASSFLRADPGDPDAIAERRVVFHGPDTNGIAVATAFLGQAEVRGPAGAAMIGFYRQGANPWGVYFGLDTDNQFAIGGWSMGASRYTLVHSGNIGAQSVNYAASAGNADTIDGRDSTYFATEANSAARYSAAIARADTKLSRSEGGTVDGPVTLTSAMTIAYVGPTIVLHDTDQGFAPLLHCQSGNVGFYNGAWLYHSTSDGQFNTYDMGPVKAYVDNKSSTATADAIAAADAAGDAAYSKKSYAGDIGLHYNGDGIPYIFVDSTFFPTATRPYADAAAASAANGVASALAIRRTGQFQLQVNHLGATWVDMPAGAVMTGLYSNLGNGLTDFMRGHYLQLFDPVRGWVGMTG